MRYHLLGRSGLRVSELCLGTMTFGEEWGWGANKDESRRLFDAFVEAGGNFFDTANLYTNGTSERFLGEFVGGERDRYVIATKYTLMQREGDPNGAGNHRKQLVQAVEASLDRLGTDYIDLYWVHAWDQITPVEEMMRALDDLVRQGKVLHVGISDAPAWVVAKANVLAEWRDWTPFVGLQIEYSLDERTPERDLLPMAEHFGLTVLDWSPLAGGVLTGKYLGENGQEGRKTATGGEVTERQHQIARAVVDVAGEVGASPAQVALAWLRYQPGHHIPILGAKRLDQLEDNLGSLEVDLDGEHLQKLDEVSRIDLGFPHDFLQRDFVRKMVFAGTRDQIEA